MPERFIAGSSEVVMKSSVNKAQDADIDALFQDLTSCGILIPDRENIHRYLIEHGQMIDFIFEACSDVFKRLGSRAQLSIELFIDPESSDAFPVLYVRQDEYEEDLLGSIDDICEKYETKLIDKTGDFLITTDFQPPIR